MGQRPRGTKPPDHLDEQLNPVDAAAAQEQQGTALQRFVEPILQVPGGMVSFFADLAHSLVPSQGGKQARDRVVEATVTPSADQLTQSATAAREGRLGEMFGHGLAGVVPVVGPAVAHGVEQIQQGDVAGGAGSLTATAAPFVVGPSVKAGAKATVRGMRGTAVGESIAASAENASTARMADTMGPKVGPNKVRLNNQAAEIAPDLAREPGLNAFSREGLHGKVQSRLADAEAGLDAAADSRLGARTVETQPIIDALIAKRDRLTSKAVEGSQFTPQSGVNRPPIGKDVVPGPNASQVAQIDRAISELQQLGAVTRYESIRRIREAYDKPARVKYSPAVSADYLAKQGEASGAADVTSVLREKLASLDPATSEANTTYSLYRTANDVLQATEEAERARPRVGRGIAARGVGAMVGAHEGGVAGAGMGAIVGGIVERASQMAPSFQIMIARRLAGVADMLRNGDVEGARATLDTTVRRFPTVKGGLKLVARTAAVAGKTEGRLAAEHRARDEEAK